MNLDELRSVQSKERQTDSLQHLRESFYADVSAYINELEAERDSAAAAADDPFADPQVRQLTDEIETAREVVEAIYDRRLGKLVKRASLAAADMPADEEGLTAEERELFDDLVERIEANKAHVLDVLDADDPGDAPAAPEGVGGEAAAGPGATATAEGAAADPSAGATATDGRAEAEARAVATPDDERAATEAGTDVTDEVVEERPPASDLADGGPTTAGGVAPDGVSGEGSTTRADPSPAGPGEASEHGRASEPSGEAAGTTSGAAGDEAGLDTRTTVRITGDVDEFYGVDEREYDLDAEDVVTLPSDNAEPLLESGDAERLE